VLAGMAYGIPLYGTMAHSFIQAHEDERLAFEHFAESQPENIVLLIDTYDTEEAARKVVRLAPALRARGLAVKGVRLDSGNLGEHARNVRRILDEGGLPSAQILASGNLDEYRVKELIDGGAPIDSFAVGTAMTTSSDAPSLDCAYKLQSYAGRPCRKRSEGKATWPGPKQVYRHHDDAGRLAFDVVATAADRQAGTPLLQPVVKAGRPVGPAPSLTDIRRAAAAQLTQLPPLLRTLDQAPPYEVRIAPSLQELAQALDRKEPALATGGPPQGDHG
jgi:nicotinate phosphoribosyltransferase